MTTQLFLYGTLMRGESRQDSLVDQEFVGVAATAPEYRLFDVGVYPALVAAEAGQSIIGELWRVSDDKLSELDDIECVDDGLYARQAVRLLSPHDGLNVETYIYLQNIWGLPEVGPSWRDR